MCVHEVRVVECAYRIPLTAQSKVENMPPQTPKLPPSTGARALMAVIAGMISEVLV